MANSDKDIIITPNRSSSTDDPKVEYRGANSSVGPQTITSRVYPTSNGTLSFEGSAGQLFSITNSLTGTIFSVNDVSGIPSIEVLDTGVVKLAQYAGNVLIGTGTNNTGELQITGNTWNNATGGDLVVRNTSTIGSALTLMPTNSGSFSAGWSLYAGASGAAIGDGAFGFWNHTAQAQRFYTTQAGDVFAASSYRAPIFYDSQDTNYYTDPASTSQVYRINARRIAVNPDQNTNDATVGTLSLWNNPDVTTSTLMFKRTDQLFGTHGAVTDQYATFWNMDSTNRGWIFRYATSTTAGSNVFSIRNNDGTTTIGNGGFTPGSVYARLNIHTGSNSATLFRDIDLFGGWSGGEGHAITATHGSSSTNIVGQMVFEHNAPGSRIKWGRLYHGGDQSTYPMHLISDGSSAYLEMNSGSIRAPIFYDYNDTAFYVDPEQVSRVKYIEGSAECSFRGANRATNDWNNTGLTTTPTVNTYDDESWYIDSGASNSWDRGILSIRRFRRVVGLTLEYEAYLQTNDGGAVHAMIGFVGGDSTSYNYNQTPANLIYHDNASLSVYTNGVGSGSDNSADTRNAWWKFKTILRGTGASHYVWLSNEWKLIKTVATNNQNDYEYVRVLVSLYRQRIYFRNMKVYNAHNHAMDSTNAYISGVAGILNVGTDVRAPIYYDSASTSYYWNPNTSGAHRLQTPSGYLDLGPMNSGFCHFQTDRPEFYFGSFVKFDGGGISAYNTDDHAYFNTYYRYNNTTYYADLSGTTNLWKLTTNRYVATGATAPSYTENGLEIYTSSNGVPTIGFHRGGYSATALYEYDGELYVNAWTTRAQTGKLLSSGNWSSYITTTQGIQGRQGIQGTSGTNGTNGSNGSQGIQGIQGTSGTNGTNGSNGSQGIQGVQGIQGRQGISGTNGTNGSNGSQGIQGIQGSSGSGSTSATPNTIAQRDSLANIYANNFYSVSDANVKENITPIVNPMFIVNNMKGVKYTRKGSNIVQSGLLAQDIEKVLPEAIAVKDNLKLVSYDSITGVLVEAIKEQNLNQKLQEERINKLEQLLTKIAAKILN